MDENKLLSLIRDYQRTPTDSGFDAIAEHIRPLINNIVNKYDYIKGYEADDLEQVCLLAIWKAIPGFDPSISPVAPYLSLCCIRKLQGLLDTSKGIHNRVLNSSKSLDYRPAGEEYILFAPIAKEEKEEPEPDEDPFSKLIPLMDKLTKFEAIVIEYLKGRESNTAIAQRINDSGVWGWAVNEQAIRNAKRQIKIKFKAMLENNRD